MFPYTAKNIKLQEKVFFCLKNSIVNTQLILFLYSKFKCLFELNKCNTYFDSLPCGDTLI